MNALIDHTLHLADNALILGHRNSEWCGHSPVLEQDIAITNISLDLIGQASNFYQYAALLKAIDELWRYTGEMFIPASYEKETGIDFTKIKEAWDLKVSAVFSEASLIPPSGSGKAVNMQTGGKEGRHSEHLSNILSEMQHLQRTHPGAEW